MTETEREAIALAIREILWMSLMYNDHNFDQSILLRKAEAITNLLGFTRRTPVGELNDFVGNVEDFLKRATDDT